MAQSNLRRVGDTRVVLGERGMVQAITLCIAALAINAVLIQTITSEESVLKNGLRVCVLLVVAFAMVMNHVRISVGIFLMILYSIIMLALRQNPDQLSFIFVFVLVMALMSIEERSLEKLLVASSVASLALVFVFLALGVTQNSVLDFRNRMTFGTDGVPFFFNLVYGAFALLVLYSHKYKLKHRTLLVLGSVAATTLLFTLTDARGGYFSLLAFVALVYLVPVLSRIGLFRFVTAFLPVIFLLFSFYIASLGQNVAANQLLSYRPALFQLFFRDVDPLDIFFSTSVKQFPSTVDNSYIHLLVGGGVVLCLAFFIIFAQAIRNLFRAGRHIEISFVIATCIYFNSESIMLRIENIFVIYFWYLILRHSNPLVGDRVSPDQVFVERS